MISGLSFRTASIYSDEGSCLNPTDVSSAIEFEVFAGGHGIAGNRRGPRIKGMSSATQVNFFNGDSCAAAGVLYTAGLFFSMTGGIYCQRDRVQTQKCIR